MTVFVVNMTNDDTSPALQFGDLRHVNLRFVYGDEINNGRMPRPVTTALDAAAMDFDPKRDYLLICGDHLQLVYFAAKLGLLYSQFRVLRWDKKAKGYIPVICTTQIVTPPK